jgi:tetratricopeptide (TPR) repeat protein
VHWCRKCSLEYTLPCPKCFHCGQDCITYPERKKELDSLVDVYKVTKDRRAERKHKWDLWKKTKSIFWKKTATDYSKWEYFTDSEDELEEIEKNSKPIVPDHDPQFRAMEKDMDERNARQKVDRKKARELKDKANELMKKKDYFRAIELYSEALDLHKQNKYLWTNRALAYLKFNEPVKAEADCTRILEYSELFEDGYTKSSDANFKAFCRRAQAKLAQQNFEGSKEDIGEALKLYPTDQGGLELKAEIEAKTATHARLQEIETKLKGEDYNTEKYLHIKACILVIDTFLELNKHLKDETKMPGIVDFDYTALLMALEEHRDAKLYFFAKKGMDLIKQIVQRELYTPDFRAEKHNLFSFMQVVLQGDETFLEETKENGIVRVTVKNLSKLADQVFGKSTDEDSDPKASGKENDQNTANVKKPEMSTIIDYGKIYRTMEELFELLTACSMNSKVRLYLRDKHHLLVPIFAKVTNGLALKINVEYELYSSVLNLFSNLFIKETLETGNELKRLIVKDHSEILLKTFGNILKKTSNKFLTLKKSTCAFLANLMLEGEVRSGALRQLL